jgi:hypothetical protein
MALADCFCREVSQKNARKFRIAGLFDQETGSKRKSRMAPE